MVVDPAAPDGYDAIAFNAGRLDVPIVPATRDGLRIVEPRLVSIRERRQAVKRDAAREGGRRHRDNNAAADGRIKLFDNWEAV
ncbi:hypothetical protein [Burkholderia perseverans]|uniref:hypothetical protein n=1 Tax=Burkholderia perseverans TaxID=2615214 RepID=UPI001FEF8C86|nr:hypothetical protein [Burkholderia perseverans]